MRLSPEEAAARRRELELRKEMKRAQRRRQIAGWVVTVVVGLVLAAFSGIITYRENLPAFNFAFNIPFLPSRAEEPVTILFLGIDDDTLARPRADAIMLIGFHPREGQVGIVSIPRDTRVQVPGRGYDRVNASLAYGGAELARETVEAFLGIDVDYYVQVDFAGFQGVVDRLGGVEMVVDFAMKYDDYAAGLHIDLAPGLQRLTGEEALHYVRYRGGLGDVSLVDPAREQYDGRVIRQLEFVQALAKQALRPDTLAHLPQLIKELRVSVKSDMPLERMISLGTALQRVDPDGVRIGLVPGVGETIGGASYWVADQGKTQQVIDNVLLGRSREQQI